MPVQALFRDAEGVKLLPPLTRAAGWERLVYCLVVNHLAELAALLAERFPGADLWPAVRQELHRHGADHDLPEIAALLTSPTLPGKTNLLSAGQARRRLRTVRAAAEPTGCHPTPAGRATPSFPRL
jgi:siderophore synthetase component